jgi:type I restriction-modification system DNA methylase subunit
VNASSGDYRPWAGGSGGMLIHAADFLIENGSRPEFLRYSAQELNWFTYAIARINVILHGLEADIRGGKSTLTDPQFLKPDGSLDRFDVVLANFPFSDDHWWLGQEQQTENDAGETSRHRRGRASPDGRRPARTRWRRKYRAGLRLLTKGN